MRMLIWQQKRIVAVNSPVISNTTPLIKLAGIGHLDLLPQLYGTISIPEAVRLEYQRGARPVDPDLDILPWIRGIKDVRLDPSLPKKLGAGEAGAISLAISSQARTLLLDERRGQQVAAALGLPLSGTLGVLLGAKEEGLIPAVEPAIDMMIAQGRHISLTLRAQVLRAAGEGPGC